MVQNKDNQDYDTSWQLVLPSINSSKLDGWQTAPIVVLPGTIRIKLDNAIDYHFTISPPKQKKKILPFVNTTTNPRVLHTLKHVEKFKI